jgi:hypothetical protein
MVTKIEPNKQKVADKIRGMKDSIDSINAEIGGLLKHYWIHSDDHERAEGAVGNVSGGLVASWFDVTRLWDCEKSPIGLCVYDLHVSRGTCMFCGESRERK